MLQKYLDTTVYWSNVYRLSLNSTKCKVLSISRSAKNKKTFLYKINDNDLEEVEEIKNLGVIFNIAINFDNKFNFDKHISVTTSKALKTLGFIKRSTKEFTSTDSIICLYKSL